MTSLTGMKALVTGASRGIGQAIALELGRQGAYIIGTATSDNGLSSIDNLLNTNGIDGSTYVLDVSDPESISALLNQLKEADQLPSILVNNAGITRDNLFMRMKDDEWNDVINTNLNSVFHLTKGLLRPMMKARFGRIINITSVVGLTGNPGQTNYAATKAGMIGFTKSLAREIGSRGITVNAVAPGFIDSDMTRELTEEQRTIMLGQIPAGRLGEGAEIAAAVAFLASPAAGYITGETINVNGGMNMQ